MRVQKVSDPVYAPNPKGGPKADPTRYPQIEVWEAGGEFVHAVAISLGNQEYLLAEPSA
jgi:catalase